MSRVHQLLQSRELRVSEQEETLGVEAMSFIELRHTSALPHTAT
jgi:hypothetical protein